MSQEDKDALFKPREGVKIPGAGEPAITAVTASQSKFSELESLFSKKKPEGQE
jgi:hypothetical protein